MRINNLVKGTFGLLLLVGFASCSQFCDCESKDISINNVRAVSGGNSFQKKLASSLVQKLDQVEVSKEQSIRITEAQKQDKSLWEQVELQLAKNQEEKDIETADLVHSIYSSLMAAENVEEQLNVEFVMASEVVNDGLFMFALKSEEAQKISFKMFDEEAFEMVASNAFTVTQGNNYKAVNVASLESGDYLLRLQNEETNQELIQRFSIE